MWGRDEHSNYRSRRSSIDQRAQEILEKNKYNPRIPDASEIEDKKSSFEATYAELLEGISLPKKAHEEVKPIRVEDDYPTSPLDSTLADSFEISATDLEVGAIAAQRMKEKAADRKKRNSIDQLTFQSQQKDGAKPTKSATPETRTTRNARNAIVDGMQLSALSSIHQSKPNSIDIERKSDFARFGSPEVSDGEFYKMLDNSDLNAIRGNGFGSIENFAVHHEQKPTPHFGMTSEEQNISHFSLPQPTPSQSQEDSYYQTNDGDDDDKYPVSQDYERDDYDDDFEDDMPAKTVPKPAQMMTTNNKPSTKEAQKELSAVEEIMQRWNSDLPTLMNTMGTTGTISIAPPPPSAGSTLLPIQMVSSTVADSIEGLYQTMNDTNTETYGHEDSHQTDGNVSERRTSLNDFPQHESISLPQYAYHDTGRDIQEEDDYKDDYEEEKDQGENDYSRRYEDEDEHEDTLEEQSSPIKQGYYEDGTETNLYEEDFTMDSPQHRAALEKEKAKGEMKSVMGNESAPAIPMSKLQSIFNLSPVMTPPPDTLPNNIKPIESISSISQLIGNQQASFPNPSTKQSMKQPAVSSKSTFITNPTEKIMTFDAMEFDFPQQPSIQSKNTTAANSRATSKTNSPETDTKPDPNIITLRTHPRSITPSPVVMYPEHTLNDTVKLTTKSDTVSRSNGMSNSRSGRYSRTYYDEGENEYDGLEASQEMSQTQSSVGSHSKGEDSSSKEEDVRAVVHVEPTRKQTVSRIPSAVTTKVKKTTSLPTPATTQSESTTTSKIKKKGIKSSSNNNNQTNTNSDHHKGHQQQHMPVTENTSKINNKLDYMKSMLSTLKEKRKQRLDTRPMSAGPPRFTQSTLSSSATTLPNTTVHKITIGSRDKSPRTSLTTSGKTLSESPVRQQQSRSPRRGIDTNALSMYEESSMMNNPISEKMDGVLLQLSREASHLLEQERKVDIKNEELILREKFIKQKEVQYEAMEKQYLSLQQEKNELLEELLMLKKRGSQQEVMIEQLKSSLLHYQIKYPTISTSIATNDGAFAAVASQDAVLPSRASQVLLGHMLQHPPTVIITSTTGKKSTADVAKPDDKDSKPATPSATTTANSYGAPVTTITVQLNKAEYEALLKQINEQESLLTAYQHENERLLNNVKQQEYEYQCKEAIYFDQKEQLVREVNALRNQHHISPDGGASQFRGGTTTANRGIGSGIPQFQSNADPTQSQTIGNNMSTLPGMEETFPHYPSQKKLHDQLQLELAYDTKIQHLEDTIHNLKEEKTQQKKSYSKQIQELQHQLSSYEDEVATLKQTPIPKLQQQITILTHDKEQLEKKITWYIDRQGELPKVLQQQESNQTMIRILKDLVEQELHVNEEEIDEILEERLHEYKKGGPQRQNTSMYSTNSAVSPLRKHTGYNKYQEMYKTATKKIKELEKTITALRDSLHKRYPDSVSNLIHTSALTGNHPSHEKIKQLQIRIEELSIQLQEEEDQHQTRVHSLRIEYDQFKQHSAQVIASLQQQIESMAHTKPSSNNNNNKSSSSKKRPPVPSFLSNEVFPDDTSEDSLDPITGTPLRKPSEEMIGSLQDAKRKIKELEETVERVRNFYLKKIEDMKKKYENQLRSLKRDTTTGSSSSPSAGASNTPATPFVTPTKPSPSSNNAMIAEYERQIFDLQSESKQLERQNHELQATVEKLTSSSTSSPSPKNTKSDNDEDTPPPPPPVPRPLIFATTKDKTSEKKGKEYTSPKNMNNDDLIERKQMEEELQSLRIHYEQLLQTTITQLTQQYAQATRAAVATSSPPLSPSPAPPVLVDTTWMIEKQSLLDALTQSQQKVYQLTQELTNLRITMITTPPQTPIQTPAQAAAINAQSVSTIRYKQLEEQIQHIERRFQLREQELQGLVENMKATFMLEKSRLISMHKEELHIKDDKLIEFQHELEELIRQLQLLKQQQQTTSSSPSTNKATPAWSLKDSNIYIPAETF